VRADFARTLQGVSRLTSRDRLLRALRQDERPMPSAVDPAAQTRALADAARVLEGAGVPYALIGGIAVALHAGVPRATIDVDLAVDSRTDLEALGKTFEAAGFAVGGRFAHSMNLRHANGEPVQLAIDAGFDAFVARAETFSIGEATVRLVLRDDLIAMKERAARDPKRRKSKALRDRADVLLLRGDVPDPEEGW
jgi:predicted nucleotidyltransferase